MVRLPTKTIGVFHLKCSAEVNSPDLTLDYGEMDVVTLYSKVVFVNISACIS